jgi:integrase/recombinase XerD
MNEQENNILTEYLDFLHSQGVKTTGHKCSVGIFFRYIDSCGLDFQRLRIAEAQDFQVYLTTKPGKGGKTYSAVTVSTITDRVRRFYDYLRTRGLIHGNPFREIQNVRRARALPRNILSEEKMNKFLRHLREFWKAGDLNERRKLYRAHVIAELMYSTGARINEVMKLTREDIDFNRSLVTVKDDKTRKPRQCILNEYAAKVLWIYIDDMREYILWNTRRKDDSLLFGAGNSLLIWLNAVLNRESNRLGLGRFTSHHFRHAVGYHLLRAGCDIRYIKEILGHEDLGTTQIYTKVDKLDLRNIIDKFHPRKIKPPLSSGHLPLDKGETVTGL